MLQVVQGLQENESLTSIEKFNMPSAFEQASQEFQVTPVCNRVVDAYSRQPIEGAIVESWLEELNPRAPGFELISSWTTGADGVYYSVPVDKGRISADGYLTLTTPLKDDAGLIELFPVDPSLPTPKLQFIDTEGNVIPNVRVTSTYSCSHDIYALDVLSDDDGIAVLPNFGFQDKVPELCRCWFAQPCAGALAEKGRSKSCLVD